MEEKSEICAAFILQRFAHHLDSQSVESTASPMFIGVNGVQGCGKSTLSFSFTNRHRSLLEISAQPPHSLPTIVISIDDFYLPHQAQQELAARYPANPLIQRRGQPSTHDVSLATSVLAGLRRCEQVRIPSYDKAAFLGQGDQLPCEQWRVVNAPHGPKVRIVLLEGWCIGFKALSDGELRRRWESAKAQEAAGMYGGRLAFASHCNLSVVNAALKQYDEITKQLDAMIHIDTTDLKLVYQWRLEQEQALRKRKGTGMTDEQLITFIDGYYPSYELYTDDLRAGVMKRPAEQLRLIVGEDRKVQKVLQT